MSAIKQKRGLGRGLGALIPESEIASIGETRSAEVMEVEILRVSPNPDQPRRHFDEDALLSLKDSIASHGVVQPILVRKNGTGYSIIAGERRWRAAKMAGLLRVPVIVRDVDEINVAQLSLIENIQREDLNDIEEAVAYEHLMAQFGLTQEDIAQAVGKSRSHIANTLRLTRLDDRVKVMIVEGSLSGGHGRALLRIEDPEHQHAWALKIVDGTLSVREIEEALTKPAKKAPVKKKKTKPDLEIKRIEVELREVLGTKVMIKRGRSKGKVEIEFYGDEDLDRIVDLIRVR
jgi:ParB family chromosome partitioning protein